MQSFLERHFPTIAQMNWGERLVAVPLIAALLYLPYEGWLTYEVWQILGPTHSDRY